MKLKELCDAAGIFCPNAASQTEISAVVTHTREAVPGCMFVCIRGLHTDSHLLLSEAVAGGATCVLTEEGTDFEILPNVIYLTAPSTRRALSMLYHAWYGYPTKKLKIIGVTGTNGKTSITHMLRAILEASLYRCGIIGTVGCESAGRCLESKHCQKNANMTTPDPEDLYRILSEMVRDGVEYVLMEVTSHALALGKLEPIQFEASIFTNLTPDHLDFHKTMDAYAQAKAILFTKSKISLINLDSPYAGRMIFGAAGIVKTTSSHGKTADYMAEGIEMREEKGVAYRLHSPKATLRVQCPLPGAFTVSNSLQAAACALELGIPASYVKDALGNMAGVNGRMERIKLGLGADFSLFIDYAHTPDALENLLRTAREFKREGGRVIVLFGCGGDRDTQKRPLMGRIASQLADFVILTSDNSRSEDPYRIIEQILSGIDPQTPHVVIPQRADAIEYAVARAQRNDLILLAGKGHEEYEITREGRRPFSERRIAMEAFEKRMKLKKQTDPTENEI